MRVENGPSHAAEAILNGQRSARAGSPQRGRLGYVRLSDHPGIGDPAVVSEGGGLVPWIELPESDLMKDRTFSKS